MLLKAAQNGLHFCGICRRKCHFEFNTVFEKSCTVFCAEESKAYQTQFHCNKSVLRY